MPVYFIYIATNKYRTVLYTGVTNSLDRRGCEHQSGFGSVFTRRYHVKYLLYAERTRYVRNALDREKQIKGWTREKKLELIRTLNPDLTLFEWGEDLLPVRL